MRVVFVLSVYEICVNLRPIKYDTKWNETDSILTFGFIEIEEILNSLHPFPPSDHSSSSSAND